MIAEAPTKLVQAESVRRPLFSHGLSVLNRYPQGSVYADSQTYPDNVNGASFPFRFFVFLPSSVLRVNYVALSFKLQAFRGYEATSAAGSSHQHSTPNHNHLLFTSTGDAAVMTTHRFRYVDDVGATQDIDLSTSSPSGSINTNTSGGSSTSGGEASHAHAMVAGIYESTVATNVKVIVNGTDRTVALGGPAGGYTSDQAELALTPAWLTVGTWNEIDLQASGLGRITGHLRVQGFVQAV